MVEGRFGSMSEMYKSGFKWKICMSVCVCVCLQPEERFCDCSCQYIIDRRLCEDLFFSSRFNCSVYQSHCYSIV